MNYELKELCLEITNKCPMNCIHCSAEASNNSKDEMDFAQIKDVIQEFSNLGGRILEISGGEPLVHDNVSEIIKYAKDANLETRLYTSGFLLSDRKIDELISSGLNKIIFNLQGSTSETHEEITRKKGSYDKVISGIVTSKQKGLWVGVHFVPMKTNIGDMKKVADLCTDLNVSEFATLRFVPQGRGLINRDKLELSQSETKYFFKSVHEMQKEPKIKTRVGRPFNVRSVCYSNSKFKKCNAGITKCLVKPNGDVAPCPAFKQNQKYVIGNIRKSRLISVWNSSSWDEFRGFDHNKLAGNCAKCNNLDSCKGGCAAQRIFQHGNINHGPDPSCVGEFLSNLISLEKHVTTKDTG